MKKLTMRTILLTAIAAMAVAAANASTVSVCAPAGGSCAASGACSERAARGEPRISVFLDAVRRVAKDRGVTLAQAAEMLSDLGIRGVDVCVADKKGAEAISATKMKIINFYHFPNMLDAEAFKADVADGLAMAKKYGVPRIMVVPSGFTKGGDPEVEFAARLAALKTYVEAGKAQGVTITTEDFGGASNPCSYAKYLKRFLDGIPDLRFALDSGNLYYAGRGDSILEMMAFAKGRIEHVHLKDQTKADNHAYATLGLGAVPNKAVVQAVARTGYAGWYTLEDLVGGDAYEDAVRQVAVLKSWIREAK